MESVQTIPLPEREVPLAEYRAQCVDVPKFLGYCAACPNYGGTWSCPPFDFDPQTVWDRYDRILLRAVKVPVPAELRKKVLSPQEINDESHALLAPIKHDLLSSLLEQERATPGSLALSAGRCQECPEGRCTKPAHQPCRQPERMRHSIESLGGDVGKTLSLYLGQELLWGREGHLPEYYILLGGLLLGGPQEK